MRSAKKLSKLTKAHNSGIAFVKTLTRNMSEPKKKNAKAKIFLAKLSYRIVETYEAVTEAVEI